MTNRLTPDFVEFETILSMLVRWAQGEKKPAMDRVFRRWRADVERKGVCDVARRKPVALHWYR